MPFPSHSIDELKTRSSILKKALLSPDRSRSAAERMRRLPALADCDLEDILARSHEFKHKDYLRVIALEEGFSSWQELVEKAKKREAWRNGRERHRFTALYPSWAPAFTNEWHRSYDEARKALDARGGYLFPYGDHYFIADGEYVAELGFDTDAGDWERIGYDWVSPTDSEAKARLEAKLNASQDVDT